MSLRDAVIISAMRTPTGKFQGALKNFTAPELGAIAIKAAVEKGFKEPPNFPVGVRAAPIITASLMFAIILKITFPLFA